MAMKLEIGKCFLCYDKFALTDQGDHQSKGKDEDGLNKNNLQGVNPDRLEVLHLLRKVLEIPEDVCGNILPEYGHPSSWINCCDSCSLLIKESKSVFDQITALNSQYGKLQTKIKDIINQSTHFDKNDGNQRKWGVKETLRSMITQASKPKEDEIEDLFFENTEIVTISTPNWNSDVAHSNYIEENDSSIPLNLPCTTDPFSLASEGQNPMSREESGDEADEGVASINIDIKEECYNSFINEDDIEHQEMNETNQIDPFEEYNCSTENRDMDLSSFVSVQLTEATAKDQPIDKPFKCDTCNKSFFSKKCLDRCKARHIAKELGHLSCGKSFNRINQLKNHKELTLTLRKRHKCSMCEKSYSGIRDLQNHELTHTGKKSHKCAECGIDFARPCHLKEHMKLVHSDRKPIVCQLCGKRFCQDFGLKNHLKRFHPAENPINAPTVISTEQKPHENNGEANINILIKEESYSAFINEDIEHQEMNHMDIFDKYGGEKRDRDASSSVSVQLTDESSKQGRDNENPFKCDTCGKSFILKRSFIDHKKLHTGEGLYYCSECGKLFMRFNELKRHKLTHTIRKGHKCSECEKSFARIDQLKKHKLKHTAKKLHECSECGQCFAKLHYLLTVHKPTHQKPYMCKFCGKRFWQDSTLKNHLKGCRKIPIDKNPVKASIVVPVGEQRFLCKFCETEFEDSNTLIDHERTHTGKRPYKCVTCGKDFKVLPVLKFHKQTHKKKSA